MRKAPNNYRRSPFEKKRLLRYIKKSMEKEYPGEMCGSRGTTIANGRGTTRGTATKENAGFAK